jgi:ATP-dependent DNA helicase Q1
VRAKPSSGKGVMDDMYNWITDNYPDKSGIVYCFSRKESEEVAKELTSRGIKIASWIVF